MDLGADRFDGDCWGVDRDRAIDPGRTLSDHPGGLGRFLDVYPEHRAATRDDPAGLARAERWDFHGVLRRYLQHRLAGRGELFDYAHHSAARSILAPDFD